MYLELWMIISVIGFIIYYFYGYWMNPFHRHKINRTMEEYFEHIKEKHPDIWEEHKLTDDSVKEFIRKVREKENES